MNLLRLAKQLAESAETAAQEAGLSISMCIIDEHGNVVLKHRMDGATLISIEMSEGKAYTAAALQAPTDKISELVLPGQPLFTLASVSGGRYVAFGGGLPLPVDGKCIGGLGISGGTSEQDTLIAHKVLGRDWFAAAT
ncbi:uncharacterized protein GlcG (DUF336 family) [Rhizobium rosettiformans]|nr:uncharacterized protein GlcG (DUF336 family) [Rhizobium rosettiformans]MDR7066722.1 uncharacterized protein GlcG (DUF336 family) [Rhizobium rosettiformans]